MAKTRESQIDCYCPHIKRGVEIDIKMYGFPSQGPVAGATTPQRCSGMSICNLFVSGKFPPLDHARAGPTGCPYMESLTTTGR
jgi:hypothetical protein